MSCIFGQAHCVHLTSDVLLSSYAYALAAMFALYTHARRSRIKEHGHHSYLAPVRRVRYFPLLLCISFLARGTWFVLVDVHAMQSLQDNGMYSNVLVFIPWIELKVDLYPLGVLLWNKISTLIYVSAFTLLLQFWSDMLAYTKQHRPTSNAILPGKRRNLLVIANVWMYVIELLLVLSKSFTTKAWFESWDGWCCALIFVALSFSLGYSAFGLRKFFQTQEKSYLLSTLAQRIAILGFICPIFFFLRGFFFLLQPISSFEPTSAPWFYYGMPELLPGLLVLSMMQVKHPTTKSSALPTERTPLVSPNHLSV